MSNPLYPYSLGAFPGDDGAPQPPPPRYSDFEVDLIAARYSGVPPPYSSSLDIGSFDSHVGSRRSAEVLYHQPFVGSHSMVGQSEALYSSNTMAKRPRLESGLPIYPQRPGEKDCAFYMSTRTCKFGDTCKFDHPLWVPEGGVPNWKEVPNVDDSYPERPGEPDCPYLKKSSRCKFKSKCKFNHPKEKVKALEAATDNEQSLISDSTILPVRPSEPICSFYAKTGKCRFGANCKFNHPKDIKIVPVIAKETIYTSTTDAAVDGSAKTHAATGPAEAHNAKGFPIRPGEVDCSFYMKTGSCKYGSICRYNHPDRPVVDGALMAPLVQTTIPTPAPIVPATMLNPAVNFLQSFDFHATHVPFYMKTGFCKFDQKCRFHHPINRSSPGVNENGDPLQPVTLQQPVTLTLAGLPRREGAEVCDFYMKSGTCKYGARCKFDHPPRDREDSISKLQAVGKEGETT